MGIKLNEGLNSAYEKLKRDGREVEKSKKVLEKRAKELDDQRIATLNILEDIEDARQKLKKSFKELKSLDRLKDEFTNIAAHELKTPLVPIIGYVDMLLKDTNLNKGEKEKLKIVFAAAYRENTLIKDILDIAKLESGAMKFSMGKVRIGDLIQDAVENFKVKADEKHINLSADVPAGLPVIYGDAIRLAQVISNLVHNAIKFTERGSIEITAKKDRNSIVVSVADTGIGIDKKYIPKLFIKFAQIDTGPSRMAEGTGLGLSICKQILKAHNGKIWISSELGKGSTFSFSLPVKSVK